MIDACQAKPARFVRKDAERQGSVLLKVFHCSAQLQGARPSMGTIVGVDEAMDGTLIVVSGFFNYPTRTSTRRKVVNGLLGQGWETGVGGTVSHQFRKAILSADAKSPHPCSPDALTLAHFCHTTSRLNIADVGNNFSFRLRGGELRSLVNTEGPPLHDGDFAFGFIGRPEDAGLRPLVESDVQCRDSVFVLPGDRFLFSTYPLGSLPIRKQRQDHLIASCLAQPSARLAADALVRHSLKTGYKRQDNFSFVVIYAEAS